MSKVREIDTTILEFYNTTLFLSNQLSCNLSGDFIFIILSKPLGQEKNSTKSH